VSALDVVMKAFPLPWMAIWDQDPFSPRIVAADGRTIEFYDPSGIMEPDELRAVAELVVLGIPGAPFEKETLYESNGQG
jgi:hypothetical protein